MARGFAFLVSKPFDLDELLSQVAVSLDLPLSAEQSDRHRWHSPISRH
jgi:hypothetical protein